MSFSKNDLEAIKSKMDPQQAAEDLLDNKVNLKDD